MQVKFIEDKETARYGIVKAGEPVEVSEEDGKAFIDNGLAKRTRATKKTTEAEETS